MTENRFYHTRRHGLPWFICDGYKLIWCHFLIDFLLTSFGHLRVFGHVEDNPSQHVGYGVRASREQVSDDLMKNCVASK